jgi:hypothetical protein
MIENEEVKARLKEHDEEVIEGVLGKQRDPKRSVWRKSKKRR